MLTVLAVLVELASLGILAMLAVLVRLAALPWSILSTKSLLFPKLADKSWCFKPNCQQNDAF